MDVVVRQAADAELEAVADLRWRWVREASDEPLPERSAYAAEAAAWARAHGDSHVPLVAVADGEVVGMAWLAIQSRVPSPRALERRSGDLQSCYVVPEHRGAGLGRRLAEGVLDEARRRGLEHVTVHSSVEAIPVYERAGFRANPRSLYADGAIPER
ncbi:GNAT family N-acetyltransferase [Agrococcus sp. TF02-05]|uniref:GNAT family N-acetyltransferase n=1 Tax=Agrococcus sp. TF02-05 TaxID=2815211 RepID=UPI001AA13CF8|nr:GNAT family N-acetyltransferase [Agrococcus sp. TF02-05]MBO1769888.1 GNAT family N-acetyltransferase [Agrococcus sp. TF02-05]